MSKKDTPIKYIVKEKSLIGNEMFEAGAEIELPEGTLPAENIEPTCDRGRAKYQEYLASNAARVASMQRQFSDDAGSTAVMAALIAKAVTEALAAQKDEENAQAARIAELEAQLKAKKKPEALA